ncbi:MAG: hypothetical protein KC978_15595, partial [Candidatus Omnitrophica bacterium]|nr:hypothetical protein [Candidatus Omnitrophota bacterium]
MRQPKLIRRIIFFLALVLPPTAGSAIQIHVSPSGSDDNPGTQEAPLATLNAARDTIRQASTDHVLDETVTVWIHDGVYSLTETFSISQEDGGAHGAIIQYRAIHPRKVHLTGGRQIPADAFEEVSDATTLERLPDISRNSVRRVDLSALGIEDLGVYPESFRNAQSLPELFFNGERMTLAQWPNEGWAEIDQVIESGPAPWRNHESDALGVFTCKGDHPSTWAKVKDLWLEGYWCFDWAAETIRVKSVDPETRQITLAKQHVYGLGSGNPAARRYRAVNLLEELDTAGEYFIDREEKALYFWPPSDLDGAEVVLSLLRDPLIEVRNASNVQFSSLVLEYGAG